MKKYLVSFMLFLVSLSTFASDTENRFAKHFNQQNGIALHGHDVVAYHLTGVEMGIPAHTERYKGVDFQFSNEKNAKLFRNDPEKYLPAYGGWCATAMAMMNNKLDINPDSFVIQDGILYLFSTSMGPALDMWLKDPAGLKAKGDVNWKRMVLK